MSIAVLVYLYCDGALCSPDGEPIESPWRVDAGPGDTAELQRRLAREQDGWVKRGTRDLCGRCRTL